MEAMYIYKRGISSNQMFNTSELDDDEFDAMSKKEMESMVNRVADSILDEINRQITLAQEQDKQKNLKRKKIIKSNFYLGVLWTFR